MIFFPAIDLKQGRCVRLRQGDMDTATVFNEDPSDQARVFENAGCRWLHVVDLDGALAGRPVNGVVVDSILDMIDIPVQLGGGIRTLATAANWLDRGVRRVILGTAALRDPDLVRSACEAYPGRIAVAIDARGGRVAVQGWSEQSDVPVLDLARRFEDVGVAAIIFTDIGRDGAARRTEHGSDHRAGAGGLDPGRFSPAASPLSPISPTIKAAGEDILAGVVCGRAIYDGRIDVARAVALLEGRSDAAWGPQC